MNLLQDETLYPFTVTAVDADIMRKKVGDLSRGVTKAEAGDWETIRKLAGRLALLPAEYASGAWRTLLFNKKIPSQNWQFIAKMLSTQSTKAVVDTLIRVQFTDPIRDENGEILTLVNYLNRMGQQNRELRRYIEKQLVARKNSPFNAPTYMDGQF